MNFAEEMMAARENTVVYPVKLNQIIPNSKESLKVGNKIIPITPSAFKDLLKISGLTNATLQHLNETLNPNAGFLLLKELNKAIGAKKNTVVSLVIDKETQKVVRIALDLSQNTTPVSASAIESMLKSLTESGKVHLNQTLITDSGTKVSFNIACDISIPLKMPGEEIRYGKQITWDMFADVTAQDLVERLVCRNGMTAIVPGGEIKTLNTESDPSSWYNTLYRDLMNPNKELVNHYEKKVLEAMQTVLSVYEFNRIKGYILSIWRDDVDRIVRYLGNDRDWKLQYENRGIDLEKATAGQLRNCPTPVNAWDAINLLTDLASHDYNTPVSSFTKKASQKMAGQILNSKWDEESWITNVPTFRTK